MSDLSVLGPKRWFSKKAAKETDSLQLQKCATDNTFDVSSCADEVKKALKICYRIQLQEKIAIQTNSDEVVSKQGILSCCEG